MLVREVMTEPVVAVSPTATVKQAIKLLFERNITAAPVVNGYGHVIGIVSEMDLLRGEFAAEPQDASGAALERAGPPARQVGDVMTRHVMTVREQTDVAELAELMMSTGVKSVPVVRTGRLVGIVSRRDLMGVLARGDERIRDDVVQALADYAAGEPSWEVAVRDGVVELSGGGDDAAEYLADVIIRTVPGVVRVVHVP
jgi:CBS domain-containing protein